MDPLSPCRLAQRGLPCRCPFCGGSDVPTLALPDLRQTDAYSCADVALRIVSAAHGWGSPRRVATATDGADPRTVEGAFRKAGWNVFSGEADVELLRTFSAMGRPAICLIQWVPREGESGVPVGHYVVVGRVTRAKVHYQCPTDGPSSLPIADFESRWHDAGRCGCAFKRWAIAAWPG